jgi:tRNA (mo5U34)-methyltransferase
MIDYSPLYRESGPTGFANWLSSLPQRLDKALDLGRHGDLERWRGLLAALPVIRPSSLDFKASAVRIGGADDGDQPTRGQLEALLREFHPWRKGPYLVHGIHIDTEWRSDLKWDRLAGHIQSLAGRLVLDVGSGNGYHCWRMLGDGARLVIGIDPTLFSVMQFQAIKQLAGSWPAYVLPLGIEDMPADMRSFDTVFSMGVLHHRRSPIDHLYDLRGLLRPGGELVLETLVVEGDDGEVLLPPARYAQMRNVWFLPSPPSLMGWMRRCGFRNVRLIDVSVTTPDEQRSTDWMTFHSLSDFLDPEDPRLTCEGLPAPRRAIILAESP